MYTHVCKCTLMCMCVCMCVHAYMCEHVHVCMCVGVWGGGQCSESPGPQEKGASVCSCQVSAAVISDLGLSVLPDPFLSPCL